ncbi:MAG: nickel pincer cofactor biosynthesis protein LarC [Methanobrevibacter thaueri]|uniref:Putative nickel insertion protein n=1 Tax=Methanobrevibacter thaueri TaxID=190975 RepID=A0A8T3V8Y6_9EURY|nr:nickel pincer cofactor biosynthesis protein LarC [Methanobrevibacter thaueri]MBE6502136.1 nickel pincer cofactor biosynthesis protein LarC [Methanobrevibacter thaueri]
MTIIIDPQSSGIAGNMIIGAFVDLGADADELKEIMEKSALAFGRIDVTFEKVQKHGIDSTFCHVEMLENKPPLNYPEFISKIENLDLDDDIRLTSIRIFERIAEAESKVHGKTLDEIHFHEVGASDAVADVIGSVYAYYQLGFDSQKIIGLPIAVGGGRVKTAHGTIPVPAPAVVEILKDANLVGGPVDSELATPTGCAIYMELCDEIKEFIPMIRPEKTGYGAGRKDFDHPNVLRIIESTDICKSNEIDVIETNIDHLTGEEIGYLFDVLSDAGARDVSITPIIMKKNRQGSLLKVISRKENREAILDAIFKETGSLGIRIAPNIHRGVAKREFEVKTFNINGKEYDVTFKTGYVAGKVISRRPEYEDLKKIAKDSGLALKDIKEMIR